MGMNAIKCSMDKCLSLEEKKALGNSLDREGISENIFLVYENMMDRLSNELRFLCVKAYENDEMIGAAFFMQVQPVDIFSSISVLGDNAFLRSIVKPFTSMIKKSCAYLCMHSSTTANIRAPFFVREDTAPDRVIKAILSFLRTDLQAQLFRLTLVDLQLVDDMETILFDTRANGGTATGRWSLVESWQTIAS